MTMEIMLLLIMVICMTMQNILIKIYTNKSAEDVKYFYNMLISFAALMFFVVTSKGFSFSVDILWYSALLALFRGISTVCCFIAVACGPLSITTLISSYSLLIPSFYGLIFLDEPLSVGLIAGVVFLMLSLYLIGEKNDKVPISRKWIINVSGAFLGGGMCTVVQKMQQNAMNGQYENEFMIIALLFVTVFLGIIALLKERKSIMNVGKRVFIFGFAHGGINGAVNLILLILVAVMPVSILMPTVNAGSMALTYLASILIFRERLSVKQFVGFCLGLAAIVMLNI